MTCSRQTNPVRDSCKMQLKTSFQFFFGNQLSLTNFPLTNCCTKYNGVDPINGIISEFSTLLDISTKHGNNKN